MDESSDDPFEHEFDWANFANFFTIQFQRGPDEERELYYTQVWSNVGWRGRVTGSWITIGGAAPTVAEQVTFFIWQKVLVQTVRENASDL